MELIEWCADYSVGHDDLDAQHKRLVDIINALGEEIENGTNCSIEQTLNSLAQYTIYHFTFEELLFGDSGHPDSLVHKDQHRRFIDTLLTYREDFENGKDVDGARLHAFLSNWLINHICISDKKMFDWIDRQYGPPWPNQLLDS